MTRALEDVAQVTEAVFQGRVARLRHVLEEEARLRNGLRRLEEMQTMGKDAMQRDPSMRAVGADFLWQGWMMRQRMTINTQLANVMVQKAAMLNEVRLAFGKSQVACDLLEKSRIKIRKDRENRLNRV